MAGNGSAGSEIAGSETAAKWAQAIAAYQRGDAPTAERLCRDVIASPLSAPGEGPNGGEVHNLLALALFAQRRAEGALRASEQAIADQPANIDFRRNRAMMLAACRRPGEAESAYRDALELAPDDPATLYQLAQLLKDLNRPAEALEHLYRLSARHGDDPAVANALAATLVGAGKPEDALGWLDRAEKSGGPAAEAAHNRATALADMGEIAASEKAAEAALALRKDLPGAWWHLGLCAFDGGDLPRAAEAFATASRAQGFGLAHAYLGATLRALGQAAEARAAFARAEKINKRLTCLREAVEYAHKVTNRQDAPPAAFGFKATLLRAMIDAAPAEGLCLEFGVFTGRSIRVVASKRQGPVHGFDSFEGLPGDWIEGEGRGSYNAKGELPKVPDNVELIPGWFDDTLPPFLAAHDAPLAFANIDCDIYSSTRTVLDALAPRLVPGSVLVFDEYFAYPGWEDHEFKAFQELCAERGVRYRYLALSPFTRQAAVRIESA